MSLEYFISVGLALGSSMIIPDNSPPVVKYFIVPLLVAYVSLRSMQILFPKINYIGSQVSDYTASKVYNSIDTADYIRIFPPLFIVFILFIMLLFNRTLG